MWCLGVDAEGLNFPPPVITGITQSLTECEISSKSHCWILHLGGLRAQCRCVIGRYVHDCRPPDREGKVPLTLLRKSRSLMGQTTVAKRFSALHKSDHTCRPRDIIRNNNSDDKTPHLISIGCSRLPEGARKQTGTNPGPGELCGIAAMARASEQVLNNEAMFFQGSMSGGCSCARG